MSQVPLSSAAPFFAKNSLFSLKEKVQFNEGCLFRIHVDADWLETDVVAIEFRLMSRHLPDTDAPTECEAPSSGQDKGSDSLKEVREHGLASPYRSLSLPRFVVVLISGRLMELSSE